MPSSSSRLSSTSRMVVDVDEKINEILNFSPNIKYISFSLENVMSSASGGSSSSPAHHHGNNLSTFLPLLTPGGDVTPSHASEKPKNAFNMMMSDRTMKKPANKQCGNDLDFPYDMVPSDVQYHIRLLTNCLWYLDGRKEIIKQRRATESEITEDFPAMFDVGKFDGFQQWQKWKTKPRLTKSILESHSRNLITLIGKPLTISWDKNLKSSIETLAALLEQVALYLDNHNKRQQEYQSKLIPARQISDNASVQHHPAGPFGICKKSHQMIEDSLITSEVYQPHYLDPDVYCKSMSACQKHRFLQDITLSFPVDVLRYDPGGGTASADQHPAMDERIKLAISTEQPDMILDLRHLNKGRPSETFDQFFSVLNKLIEELVAADDRRHGVAHMSQFLSVPDLIKQVRLSLPDGVPVPSESTVYLSFAPPNTCSEVAKHYTGRVNLKHKVQSRQLRQSHPDAHYAAAQWKYMRSLAVHLGGDRCILMSADDKAKIPVGEPGLAISSGVRGKQSIAPTEVTLAALDHDVLQKGSIVPSVILDISIPDVTEESFYRGQVSLTLKDSVFEASSPNRFAAEVCQYWDSLPEDRRGNINTLLLFADGGPDHISTFEHTNVDLLVAARTAPGQSYINPVERVMSILNVALQNVAIERSNCSEEVEKALKSCNTVESIRKKEAFIKEEWKQSMAPVTQVIAERMQRCSLKERTFVVYPPSSPEDINKVWQTAISIDNQLEVGKLQQQQVKNKKQYEAFKEKHCKERHYCFQIRKCNDEECCQRTDNSDPDWLPDPVVGDDSNYKDFSIVYGTETTDENRPSVKFSTKAVTAEEQVIPWMGLSSHGLGYRVPVLLNGPFTVPGRDPSQSAVIVDQMQARYRLKFLFDIDET
ncbi:hypothetical protein LOTGIDRAFT_173358 [Lottia gigantea]|uniref:Uncharacterized protein n=1 Tax=Lottia gigantea TaxID=225164 RepID=V4A8A4_LOTGI|nr:hypothetical protein LOTGIDRAFT_173358 [Lottia gigantea]ESP00199.1 hypothetical protein LOTGIDRAFT_173358 [Lottia gigantea]